MLSQHSLILYWVRFKFPFKTIFELCYLIAVVGEKEKNSKTVNVRTRDNVVHGELSVDDLITKFKKLSDNYTSNEEQF